MRSSGPASSVLPLRWACPTALLSGLLTCLAFPPLSWRPLSVVGTLVLLLAVRGRSAAGGLLVGVIAGLGLMLPLLSWLVVSPGGVGSWLALVGLESVLLGAGGLALALASRVPGWPLLVAGVWVAQEGVRGRAPFGGFTWGRLAFANDDGPLTPWAAVGGAPLVSWLVVAAAASVLALGLAARRLRHGSGDRWSVIATAMFAVALLGGAVIGGAALPDPARDTPVLRVALVQGNVPRLGLDGLTQDRVVLDNHVRSTVALANAARIGIVSAPDLVLWPENSSDEDPTRVPEVTSAITSAVDAVGVPVLVGAVLERPDGRVENAGLLFAPGKGEVARYVKRHLVPFGEYLPGRSFLAKRINAFAALPRDFAPGRAPGLLRTQGTVVGDVICFEIAYDDLVRDVVAGGAQLLVVQTNNATFTENQSRQQLAMSRLRAVEHGREVLVVATSGVSAVVRADGSLAEVGEWFTPAVLSASVPLRTARTPASRWGLAVELALGASGLAAALWGGLRLRQPRRRSRGQGMSGDAMIGKDSEASPAAST